MSAVTMYQRPTVKLRTQWSVLSSQCPEGVGAVLSLILQTLKGQAQSGIWAGPQRLRARKKEIPAEIQQEGPE